MKKKNYNRIKKSTCASVPREMRIRRLRHGRDFQPNVKIRRRNSAAQYIAILDGKMDCQEDMKQKRRDKIVVSAKLGQAIRSLLAAAVLCCVMIACDNAIYDNEGDCTVTYRLMFRYDRNMKHADAFSREVHSIRLYAFDRDGVLVWENSERGDNLASDGYSMRLDLPAGDYRLVAWCGLDNDGERGESFALPETRVGATRIEELQCRLNREYDGATAYCGDKLHPLYHGILDVNLPKDDDGGDYCRTMNLTKDTNHVRVILQNLSGEDVDVEDFEFRIEEENGLLNYDNALLADETITYKAYDKKSGTAGLGIDDYPEKHTGNGAKPLSSRSAVTSVSVAIADLAISRLVPDRKTYLTVTTLEGETAARIPLTDYALLLKDGYDADMTDGDYLDCQDEYTLTFFLDENRVWIGSSIIINSWKIVFDDIHF